MQEDNKRKIKTLEPSLGLLGHNIGYSLSPSIHNFASSLLGFADTYTIFDLEEGELKSFLQTFWNRGGKGLNVTKPFKQVVVETLGGQGSCNTLYRGDTYWQHTSTDGIGFVNGLRQLGLGAHDFDQVVFIGSGGAALSVAEHLNTLNPKLSFSYIRRSNTNDQLFEQISTNSRFLTFTPESLALALGNSERSLLIQATSLPLMDNSLKDFANAVPKFNGAFVELTYNVSSALLEFAKEQEIPFQDGIPMLIEQALASQALWWGQSAPYDKVFEELAKNDFSATN